MTEVQVLGLIVVVVLGAVLLAGAALSRRLHVAPPVLLLFCGVALGFVPALRAVQLPPEMVLLLFLPVLLYWESLTTSPREIRSNLRTITLNSTVLVLLTAAAVATCAHALGLGWGPAWVLGAAVAPTDATAVGVLARSLPRRTVTVLRAESLVNDGTALVLYGLAVGITVGEEHLGVGHVGWLLLLAYGGGVLAGIIVAWLGVQVRKRVEDPLQESVAVLLLPFTAYLLAEAVHASGVLAVVCCGLIMSQAGPRVGRAATRAQTTPFFTLATYLLNGALFVLVGLQVQAAVRGLSSVNLTRGLVTVAAVSATVIAARFVWLFTTPYLIRVLDRRPQQRARRVGARVRVVNGVAGFRGAVSLAAALAVPHAVASGQPFPARDLIIFVTTGVIIATLVIPALIMPAVVRWARLPADDAVAQEQHLAETTAVEAVLSELPKLAAEEGIDDEIQARVRHEYEKRLRLLRAGDSDNDDEPAVRYDQQYTALRTAALTIKRDAVLQLRDQARIDDTVLRRLQARLDLEELRLTRRVTVE
ncbi:Na+/H+ antiporter [Actinoplanes friuliensis]|uniref:Na+/H+ antiporter n=1 Tax=Actinoplanes friuliensis DSM 7358 TaxID=1246995 RepID=U5VVW8_9ACTN|nr:Na+/H+ antiporter [Actinoplanes friuliensis]AGZ41014.1 Na+/H+ antiporter [Actinoplanes friuliensis DSM 7358]